jgi:hypothetical protein
MTEADWLKTINPDAMLRRIGDRLTPRRWHLLACAAARRAADALPDGPFHAALEWVERHAGQLPGHPDAASRRSELESLAPVAAEAARLAQRQIVLTADPDADPDDFKHDGARKANPSAPLFQSACMNAATAVEHAGTAAEAATQAVIALLTEPPGTELLEQVRAAVVEATRLRGAASISASASLELKTRGDEAADRGGKNVRVQYAAALETVRKFEEGTATKVNDLEDQRQRADRKAIGRFLLDMVGNPFKPYRFEPAWRTETVVGLARAIYDERAFDRMPVLADALLDADCDEEAVLRHCRGTEAHTPEGPAHVRGCWVLDLILENEPAFFQAASLEAPPPPPPPAPPKKPTGRPVSGDPMLKLFEALKRGAPPPDDDD